MTRIHIFRPGRHIDSGGTTLDFSEAALRAAAAAYDPALHEAPLVAGHPRHDLPAYGWVLRLEVDEDGLHAIPTQVDAAFSEIVQEGRYKHISASFYLPEAPANPTPGTLYLRHVGFLGAQPPAVKGLKHIEFSASEEGVASFEDALPIGTLARLFRGIREWFVASGGIEAADRAVPSWDVEELERRAGIQMAREMDAPGLLYDEGAPSLPEPLASMPDAEADAADLATPPDISDARAAELDAREADLAAREAAAADADARRAAEAETEAQRRAAADAAEERLRTAAAFAEPLVASGQLLPREAGAIAQTLAALDAAGATVSFGEGDEAEDVSAADALRSVLARLPRSVDYEERGAPTDQDVRLGSADFAGAPGTHVSSDRLRLHQKALHYAEQHGTTYVEAVRAIGG